MSKIQLTELKSTNSELNLLSDCETTAIVGGREVRNYWGGVNISNIVQINNAININLNFGNGDIYNTNILTNRAGSRQS